MMLALDTNVVIEVLRRSSPHLRARLSEADEDGSSVFVSAVVFSELAAGALVSSRPALQLARIDEFLQGYPVEPFTAEDALSAARVRADLQRRGASIGAMDMLIAGHALARGWTLVTADVHDFIRVEGLTLLDWSDPDEPRLYDAAARRPR